MLRYNSSSAGSGTLPATPTPQGSVLPWTLEFTLQQVQARDGTFLYVACIIHILCR